MPKLSGFAEAAALNTQETLETPREPRNYNAEDALRYLTRGRKISKFYHHGEHSNGVWTPQNLRRGQILRCDLPTDYNRDGYVTHAPRNILCLGVDVDPNTLQPLAIRALRFSYNSNAFDSAHELYIAKSDPEANFGTENSFTKDAILRSGSAIDIIPLNSVYWGHFIEVMGTISPEYMPHIEDAIVRGYDARKHMGLRNYAESDTKNNLSLTALTPDLIRESSEFLPSEKVGNSLLDMCPNDKDTLFEELIDQQVFWAYGRQDQIHFEMQSNNILQNTREHKENEIRELLKNARKSHKAAITEQATLLMAQKIGDHQEAIIAQEHADEDPSLRNEFDALDNASPSALLNAGNMPTISQLLEVSLAEIEERGDLKSQAGKRLKGQKADRNSIEDLVDFGIGGLAREPDINLHKYMWLGRYHMLRVPSLIAPSRSDDTTNRPCALTRAWVQPDDNGDLHISHMAFIPCTRGESNHFKYKMKTRPLDTTIKKPTMLIAEMEIIVPVNAENFQPNQPDTGTFFELLPEQVDTLLKKRDLAKNEHGELQYYGMRPEDLPDDCHEITLPEPPNEKLRKKFINWGIAKFIGQNKAPTKRGMRGSHYTARNFQENQAVTFHQAMIDLKLAK